MNFDKIKNLYMKKVFFSLCLVASLTPSVGRAQTEKVIKTNVQKATVFQQGALLSSTEMVSLGSGTTNIIFENVSPQLQAASLQAVAKNDLVVMDVQYRLKYAEQTKADLPPNDPRVLEWQHAVRLAQDSLEDLGFVRREIQQKTQTLQAERNIISNNRLMRGEMQRDSLPLFMQSVEFYRKRLFDIDAELLKLEKESAKENKLRQKIAERINRLNALIAGIGTPVDNTPTKPVPQVIVTVMAERPMVSEITLTYFVAQAGWAASYDLRASKEAQKVEIKHRATVYQNTGIDWKDVYLTLSTGNPNQSNTKPTLTPQYLAYPTPPRVEALSEVKVVTAKKLQDKARVQPSAAPTEDMKDYEYDAAVTSGGVTNFTTVTQNLMRIEYEIKLKYSIESDNKQHNVVIQSKTVPAMYSYSIIPKLDPDAFLMARITDWEDMNLIAGSARVYFDNSYIGESYINPNNTNDTLQLNLGRDKSIIVTRTRVKDKTKDKIFSDNRVWTRTFDIAIRNTKNIPIRIIIEDQMPITKEQDIKIDYLEKSNGQFNTDTGTLTWDFTLSAKDTKKLRFSYEVKAPKDKIVNNL